MTDAILVLLKKAEWAVEAAAYMREEALEELDRAIEAVKFESGAAEEVSRIALAAQEAADYWLRLHPS
jgi:hypothetical protein